jgi:hypothetical protein
VTELLSVSKCELIYKFGRYAKIGTKQGYGLREELQHPKASRSIGMRSVDVDDYSHVRMFFDVVGRSCKTVETEGSVRNDK